MNPLTQPDLHPDAEVLCAFVEHQLAQPELDQTLAHLATCSRCRQITFLAQQAADSEQTEQTLQTEQSAAAAPHSAAATPHSAQTPTTRPGGRLSFFPNWRFATLATAACAALIAVSLWLYPHSRPNHYRLEAYNPEALKQAPVSREQSAVLQPGNPHPERQTAPQPATQPDSQSGPRPAPIPESKAKSPSIPLSGSRPYPVLTPPRLSPAPPAPNLAGASFGSLGVTLPPSASPNLALSDAAARVQVAAGIEGRVLDSTGAAVANARVAITETANRHRQETTTNDTGSYTFANLNPGSYRIDVTAPGFEELSRDAVINQTAQTARTDLTLNVGSAAETVSVAASAAPVTEEQAQAQASPTPIDSQPLLDLPLKAKDSKATSSSETNGALAANTPLSKARTPETDKAANPETRPSGAGFASTARTRSGVIPGGANRSASKLASKLPSKLASNTLQQPLPNGQKPIATAAAGNLLLAIDSTGALLLSNDSAKTWQAIPPQWTGHLVALRATSTPAAVSSFDTLNDKSAAPQQAPKSPSTQFEIVTDQNAVYRSTDGRFWKLK